MTSRWPRTAVSFTLLALPWIASARADDAPRDGFRLVWVRGDGTESCADQESIAEGVTRRVGRRVISESARRSVEGFVQHEGDSWEAHIYVRDEKGRPKGARLLTSQDSNCDAIQTAATLAIALAIDPDAATPGGASAAASSATSALSVTPPAPLPPAPTVVSSPLERSPSSRPPSPEPRSSVGSGSAGLRAVSAFGLLPGPAPGLALSTEIRLYRWLRATGGALYLPEQPTADGGFAFGLTVGRLGACARAMESSRVNLSVCADVLAGSIHSVVFALEPLRPGDRAWWGGAFGSVLHVRLAGPLEGQMGADLVLPFTREAFVVQGHEPAVFQEPPVAGVLFAGVGLSIQ